jgi:hypothetical protein
MIAQTDKGSPADRLERQAKREAARYRRHGEGKTGRERAVREKIG